jgi:hypothetical protein
MWCLATATLTFALIAAGSLRKMVFTFVGKKVN